MSNQNSGNAAMAALEEARGALSKLPILGPALWLYAKDPIKKFMFLGDTDWAVLPPIILDQCRLYTKNELPYAFITWALVNDAVAARLKSGQPKIAPHEWQTGDQVWIIDAVAPFGQLDETLRELRNTVFSGKTVSAFVPSHDNPTRMEIKKWTPESPDATP